MRPIEPHGTGNADTRRQGAQVKKEAIGLLNMNRFGRWEIRRECHVPYELTSGSRFLIEADGVLRVTSVEFRHDGRGGGRYYSTDGYDLTGGLRAAPPGEAVDGQELPQ
jgi:hypothetical protein